LEKINSKKSFILIIILFFLLVGGRAVQGQNDFADFSLEDFSAPTELADLINKFSQLDYRITLSSEGEEMQDTFISYNFAGLEEVQGVETELIVFEISGEEDHFSSIKIWLAGEDVKQMEIDGEVIPAFMAGVMKDTVLMSVMFPFYNFADFAIEEFEEIGEVSIRQEYLAGQEVDIIRIEVEQIPEFELERGITEIAKFDDFMVLFSYDYSSAEEDLEVKFSIEGLEFR